MFPEVALPRDFLSGVKVETYASDRHCAVTLASQNELFLFASRDSP